LADYGFERLGLEFPLENSWPLLEEPHLSQRLWL
jgi:hypothetical protein